MFRKHRVEIITFAVALTVSASIFLAMELKKPDHGIFLHLKGRSEVRHRQTGEVLLEGKSKRQAVTEYLNWRRDVRSGPNSRPGRCGENTGRERSPMGTRYRLEGADLNGVDFSDADLIGLRLRNAYCEEADFRGAFLMESRLDGTRLNGADFRGASIAHADLSGADLSGANLAGAVAQGVQLQNAILRGCDLSGADFAGANFRGADLAEATFDNRTYFGHAHLSEALNLSEGLRAQARRTRAKLERVEAGEPTSGN